MTHTAGAERKHYKFVSLENRIYFLQISNCEKQSIKLSGLGRMLNKILRAVYVNRIEKMSVGEWNCSLSHSFISLCSLELHCFPLMYFQITNENKCI